jgi:hypothetical protein
MILTRGNYAQVAQTVEQRQDYFFNIVNFGATNVEPQIVNDVILNCGLAQSCTEIFASFLFGAGFSEGIGNVVCNSDGETLNDILDFCASQMATFYGFALHFEYDAFLQIKEIRGVQYPFVRKSYPYGKVKVWDNWAGESPKLVPSFSDIVTYDEYRHNESFAEISEKFDFFEHWGGQIGFFGYGKRGATYPNAPIRPVLKDAMTSAVQSNFRYRSAKNNFSASKILEFVGVMSNEAQSAMQRQIEKFMGDENAGSVMVIRGGTRDESGNFQSAFKIHDTDIQSVDKLFEVQHEQINSNIVRNFRIPLELFAMQEGSKLNSGSEAMKFAYAAYNNYTQKQRTWLSSELSPILTNFLGTPVTAQIAPQKFEMYE